MGGTHMVEEGLCRPVSGRGLLLWLALAWAWPVVAAAPAAASPAGCVVAFRHGEVVRADRCEEAGEAVGYVRFGGWVVVPKSLLASVEDQTGLKRLNPPWTPAEESSRLQGMPQQGGVPVGPAAAEVPPSPPPQVVYVPVPTPEPSQPVYEVAAPAYGYAYPVVACRHCPRRHPGGARPPFVRVVPTSSSDIGPQAIQKTFPSISPIRSR